MSDKSSIEWTEATWNPTTGCTKVSPGCAHCYIEHTPPFRINGRRFVNGHIPLQLHEDRLTAPLHWRRPRRVFVNSLSDLFHQDVPDSYIDRVFAVMALAPQHTFQVLTKRAERMRAYLAPGQYRDVRVADAAKAIHTSVVPFALPSEAIFDARRVALNQSWLMNAWPLPNVWLGPSVENNPMADQRFPIAVELGVAGWNVMVSMEPLLSAVTIPKSFLVLGSRAWVIVGGESGHGARPFDLEWARSIVRQCQTAGVACFVKQLGAMPRATSVDDVADMVWRELDAVDPALVELPFTGGLKDRKGGDPYEWPADLRVREFPAVRA